MIREYPIIDASKFPTVYTNRVVVRSPRKVIEPKKLFGKWQALCYERN